MDKVIQITIHRPLEFGQHTDTFCNKKFVCAINGGLDQFAGEDIEVIAERMFILTNAPEEHLGYNDMITRKHYADALDRSQTFPELKYFSISKGDLIKAHGYYKGRLFSSFAVCQTSGWKVFRSWRAPKPQAV